MSNLLHLSLVSLIVCLSFRTMKKTNRTHLNCTNIEGNQKCTIGLVSETTLINNKKILKIK